MPIVIEEFTIDPAPSTNAATDAAPGRAEAGPPTPAWTAAFAQRLQAELALAAERAARLQAD